MFFFFDLLSQHLWLKCGSCRETRVWVCWLDRAIEICVPWFCRTGSWPAIVCRLSAVWVSQEGQRPGQLPGAGCRWIPSPKSHLSIKGEVYGRGASVASPLKSHHPWRSLLLILLLRAAFQITVTTIFLLAWVSLCELYIGIRSDVSSTLPLNPFSFQPLGLSLPLLAEERSRGDRATAIV